MQTAHTIENLLRSGACVELGAQTFPVHEIENFCRIAKSSGGHVTITDRFAVPALETFALIGGNHVTIKIQ